MSRDEALVAVYVAGRALQRHGPTNELLAALFAAVEAVDAVGESEAVEAWMPRTASETRSGGVRADIRSSDTTRPGFCPGDDGTCWRAPDLPTGTCHHHSEHAAKPHPWEQSQLRAGVLAPPEEA